MQEGLDMLHYMFLKFKDLLFAFQLIEGVRIYWLIISIFVVNILIQNILSIGKASQSYKKGGVSKNGQ